jgi:SAM-dependent methyltransferase
MSSLGLNPDTHATGLIDGSVDALRYDGHSDHPLEVAGILRAMMPAGVRVLDVGCGTGSVTAIANRGRSNDVVAVEPDPDRARAAEARGLDVRIGVLTNDLQRQLGMFDVVMSSDVLEHTPAPEQFLTTLAASLKPDGLLLLSVPNVAHWSVRQMLLRGRFDYEDTGIMDATHLRWFTARTLRDLLDRSGFEVVEMRHTAGTTLPIYCRRILRRAPRGLLEPAVRLATRAMPLLFGVQHVVKARLRRDRG